MPFDEVGYSLGPLGEIYPSSSSGEEEEVDEKGKSAPKRLYIPRCKIQAYKYAEGKVLKVKAGKPFKFTLGTDPLKRDILSFITD